ncbi:YopX family protein [Campylobacter sp.]|uniref:YopX family protein n=1 Tax=Campylobacter sp. TaxID=205 RepID=UPI00360AAAC3
MRDVKFKAYIYDLTDEDSHPLEIDVRAGKLWDVVSINFKDRIVEIMDDDGNVWEYELSSDEIALVQYTGLKDQNNAEIYEGDIVKGNFIKDNSEAVGKIAYFNKDASFICHLQGGDYALLISLERLEVVGNIYENPEILQ